MTTIMGQVDAAGMRWHVGIEGRGPALLLLHGTGTAAHSWRALVPVLAQHFTVVTPDLPGHGGSGTLPRDRTHVAGMADAMLALLRQLRLEPGFVAGHSAGAAIAAQMALAAPAQVQRLAWINPALLPFDGWPGVVFAPLARWMAAQPIVPRLVAWRARDRRAVQRLLAGTGSSLDDDGVAHYQRLVSSPSHVAGALAMMAGWDLAPLKAALPRLQQPVLLIVGDGDRTVPPAQAVQVATRLPQAELLRLPGLGHLAHEEQPQVVARALTDWFAAADANERPPR